MRIKAIAVIIFALVPSFAIAIDAGLYAIVDFKTSAYEGVEYFESSPIPPVTSEKKFFVSVPSIDSIPECSGKLFYLSESREFRCQTLPFGIKTFTFSNTDMQDPFGVIGPFNETVQIKRISVRVDVVGLGAGNVDVGLVVVGHPERKCQTQVQVVSLGALMRHQGCTLTLASGEVIYVKIINKNVAVEVPIMTVNVVANVQ